jgi:ribosome recycling factor
MGEKVKVAIRNIRREANEDLKKNLKIKKFLKTKKILKKIYKNLTDNNIDNIEKILVEKEKEIIQI